MRPPTEDSFDKGRDHEAHDDPAGNVKNSRGLSDPVLTTRLATENVSGMMECFVTHESSRTSEMRERSNSLYEQYYVPCACDSSSYISTAQIDSE